MLNHLSSVVRDLRQCFELRGRRSRLLHRPPLLPVKHLRRRQGTYLRNARHQSLY